MRNGTPRTPQFVQLIVKLSKLDNRLHSKNLFFSLASSNYLTIHRI